jgi:hypothetical protein
VAELNSFCGNGRLRFDLRSMPPSL